MVTPLNILILAPIKRPITLDTTVSRNRVIVDLVTGLTSLGHKVTILGTGDSNLPGVTFIPVVSHALNTMPASENPFYQHTAYLTKMISEAVKLQGEFDIIHNHMYPEYLALLSLSDFKKPLVTTVHSQMTPETIMALTLFPHANLVAISLMSKNASGLPMTVVHNSVDTDFFVPLEKPSLDYLLFVGRMSKAKDEKGNFMDPKGVQHAIELAEKTGESLKIVGNVEDPLFFETLIKPHLTDTITFVGEVTAEQKLTREQIRTLFQNAKAFVNPINWEEPFGLVMAESMSVGTPVVAFNRGAVSELIEEGKTGFIVDPKRGVDGLSEGLSKISTIARSYCREYAVKNFSKQKMVSGYETVYRSLLTTG